MPILQADTYRVTVLARVKGDGLYQLLRPNSTFNEVLVSGVNVTFVLKTSSPLFAPSQLGAAAESQGTAPPYQTPVEYSLVGPFLVKTSRGEILEVSIRSESTPSVELLEAKVGNGARAMINGEELLGSWYDGLDGWVFPLNWTNPGEPSVVLIHKNNTISSFSGILHASANEVDFSLDSGPYREVHLRVLEGSVELEAKGNTIPNVELTEKIPVSEFFGIYISGQDSLLISEAYLGRLSYTLITPERCESCIVGEFGFERDPNFKLNAELEVPKEAIGGSAVLMRVSSGPDIDNMTLYLPGEKVLLLENMGFPYEIELALPLTNLDVMEDIYLTVHSTEGLYGLKKALKILRSYEIRMLNRTPIFLIGGKGDIHISAINLGDGTISLLEARVNLTTKKGEVLSLKFPLSVDLQGNRSQRIVLPLNLPVGDYKATLLVSLVDQSGETHWFNLGEMSIVSTNEDPLNALLAISPDMPNIGDNVTLKVSFTNMVPLERVLIGVNVTGGLEPISDTSKLLKEIPEGSTRELTFQFRAKEVGPAKLTVILYYVIEGGGSERSYIKELKIPIGGVSGRASIEVTKTEVEVGEKFSVKIRVEDVSGNVTVEFPAKMIILEAKGRIKGNKVEYMAPGEIEVMGLFKEEGAYTIPTYVSVNGSLLIPSNTVTIKAVGKGGWDVVEKSLRSKLADLKRRYRTLKEASGNLGPLAVEKLNSLGKILDEAKKLIDEAEYERASELLSKVEDELSSIEEYAFSSLDRIMSSLMYFLIGIGITSAILLALRLKKGSKHGSR